MICNNILEAMGNTPIIRLQHLSEPDSAEILVKFEGLNVGGSIKTRTAYNMILEAEKAGIIKEDTIIVEPTSQLTVEVEPTAVTASVPREPTMAVSMYCTAVCRSCSSIVGHASVSMTFMSAGSYFVFIFIFNLPPT